MRIRMIFAAVILAIVAGCRSAPAPSVNDWAEVECSECNGDGKVIYQADHWLVRNSLAEAGVDYQCSMCQGSGVLLLEEREK